MKTTKAVYILLLLFFGATGLHAQPIAGTAWRGNDMLRKGLGNAIWGFPADSVIMKFSVPDDWSVIMYAATDTLKIKGIWWQIDATHLGYYDTMSFMAPSLCSGNDTSINEYTVGIGNLDTLTIKNQSDKCALRGAFFSSDWYGDNFTAASVTDIVQPENLVVYPNPIVDELTIAFHGLISGATSAELTLYDMQGKVYKHITAPVAKQDIKIDGLKQLEAGIYFLHVNVNNKIQRLKVVK